MATEAFTYQKPLSPAERRQRNRQEMSDAILNAARVVMRRDGVAALNLNEVARLVGIRPPALYKYFPSKAAIYDALFRKAVRLFQDGLDRIWMDYPPGWERIQAIFEYNLTFAHEHPDLYELWSGRPVPGFVPSEESMEASWKVVADAVQGLGEVIDAGVMAPPLPIPEAADLLIAVIRGLTAMHIANEPEVPGAAGRFGQLVPWAVALFQSAWAGTAEVAPTRPGKEEKEQ
jgi:AcrR family transcriptional regulator